MLSAALGSIRSLVLAQDLEGRFHFVSPSAAQAFGLAPDEMTRRTWREIGMWSGTIAAMERLRKEAVDSGATASSEISFPDRERCYHCTVAPVGGPDDAVEGTVTVAEDITDRKELEVLRGMDSFLRATVEGTTDPMFVKDREGRYLMVNPATLKAMGKTQEEVIGHTDEELSTDRSMVRSLIEAERNVILTGMSSVSEQKMATPDGLRVFLLTRVPNRDPQGRIIGLVGIARDITERKRLENALILREQRFSSLIENAPVAIGISRHGMTLYGNPRYLEMFGIDSVEDLYSRPFVEQIAPEDRERAMGYARRYDEGMTEEPEVELMGLRKDGSRFPFLAAITGVHLTDGPALLGFFMDITERKKLERKLEEAKSRAELYVDLLTHDISNYNTAAMGYLQLAEVKLDMEEKERRLITSPLQVLADSSELIANIRDLQRVEAGRERAEPIDVCRMLREVRETYESPPDKHVAIELQKEDDCLVVASPLLRGAFSNIVSNAVKHSPGPVEIGISVGKVAQEEGRYVRVEVEDNGPGIADERKETIFDRSLMGLTRPVSRGLGLYLVKRLVEEFGGKVWVEDRVPGDHTKGARFVVMLPSAEPGTVSPAEAREHLRE